MSSSEYASNSDSKAVSRLVSQASHTVLLCMGQGVACTATQDLARGSVCRGDFLRDTFPRLTGRLNIDLVQTLLATLSASGVSIGRSAVPG